MKANGRIGLVPGVLALLASPVTARAQAPGPVLSSGFPSLDAWSSRAGVEVVTIAIVTVAIVVVAVMVYARARRRRNAARALETVVSDALLLHPSLRAARIVAVAHVSLWGRSLPVVSLAGAVPRPEMADIALQIAARELARDGYRVHVRDRIVVDVLMVGHVA
jgi:hypothetical protein